jgi:hypothetical protein
MGLRDLRRRRGREGKEGTVVATVLQTGPSRRPRRRLWKREREETLGPGSGAPPWPAAASGREQGDSGRARGRGAPYPRVAAMAPAALLEATRSRQPLLPRSRHAAPSASSSGLPAAAPNTVSCRHGAVPRSLAPAPPRGEGRRPAAHRRQREQRRPELAPPPRVGRRGGGDADAPESDCRGKMPTRLAPAGVDRPCSST